MFAENQNEIGIAEKSVIDLEKIWGGDESKWANWRKAERNKNLADYMKAQRELILSDETKKAFEDVYGTMVKEPNEDLLATFFIEKGGAIFFRRQFFQNRGDIDFKIIEDYYENKRWNDELSEWFKTHLPE
jgi:hypothetical protein